MTGRTLPGWPRGLREELAAAYVGMSVNGLRTKVEAGEIEPPRRHSSGRIVYLRDNLDAYLDRLFNVADPPTTSAAPDPVSEWDEACGLGRP